MKTAISAPDPIKRGGEKEKGAIIPMAVLRSGRYYPCVFDLKLSEWERYAIDKGCPNVRIAELGGPTPCGLSIAWR